MTRKEKEKGNWKLGYNFHTISQENGFSRNRKPSIVDIGARHCI